MEIACKRNKVPLVIGKARSNRRFGALATKFFDDKVPLKKKLRWLKRKVMFKDDGTIEFEVLEDIKPECIVSFAEVMIQNTTWF